MGKLFSLVKEKRLKREVARRALVGLATRNQNDSLHLFKRCMPLNISQLFHNI